MVVAKVNSKLQWCIQNFKTFSKKYENIKLTKSGTQI